MTEIIVRCHDGSERLLTPAEGESVMQAAVAQAIPGIVGECGGAASCATCHVYVEESTGDLSPVSDVENEMLDFTAGTRLPGSRLGCQLKCGPWLPRLVIRIPDTQV